MSTAVGVEGMSFLTQSPVRVRILERLYDHEGLRKRELKEQSDASRVTVRRNMNALEERDLITIEGRTCEITPLGEVVVEDVLPALKTVDVLDRLRPFVRWFPDDELEFDVCTLEDATIITADSNDPYAPVNRYIEVMETADRFRGLLPTVGLPAMTVAYECTVEAGYHHEIVVSERLARTVLNRRGYSEFLDEMLASGNCTLFVSDREIRFYLGLFEECVQIGVEGDDGTPKALVETDATEVREWAEQTYDQYVTQAELFAADT
ncbi:transcriptional regulator [Natronococcus sp. A-GB1]|uniref:helix-turn-helix transcriptional regulator n=1 Tax=Natronococcus sp. A-GB1 TaxID=3037648 RepID=UPI00241C5983|nr:transcriptional regulator [Natronococcus sp. A-GB1]MDG5759944.1 transcriptional regulator [Natronococcus sp. A-GB1]